MAAELNGMAFYAWLISIPGLAAAFVTLIFLKFSDMYGRRLMMLVSLTLFLAGTVLSAISPTFSILIAANTLARLGSGALAPLCLAVLGDIFPPVERSRWVGLLNIPAGIFALVGPTLGGWFVDNLSWRYIYWMDSLGHSVSHCRAGGRSFRRKQRHPQNRCSGLRVMIVASSATMLVFPLPGDISLGPAGFGLLVVGWFSGCFLSRQLRRLWIPRC
jgi:MFS family permease